MFVQLITGPAGDTAGLRKDMDRWVAELAPGAAGYRGGTAGVAEDGRFVLVAVFSDAASARANSNRPEQDAWWRDLEAHLAGPASFEESEDIDIMGEGWTPRAGFVQIIRGQAADPEGMRRRGRELESRVAAARPDLIGGISLWHDDGRYTDVGFFSSEAEAREAERKEPPADLREAYQEMVASAREYIDLRDPWHTIPGG
jgi:hypothetical protein